MDKIFKHRDIYALSSPSAKQLEALCCADSCGKLHATKDYKIDRDGHDKLLFVYVKSGAMFLEYCGEIQTIYAGGAFLIDCMHHQVYGALNSSCSFEFLHFLGGFSKYFYKKITEENGYVLDGAEAKVVKKLIESVIRASSEHSQSKTELLSAIVTNALYELLTLEPEADIVLKQSVEKIREAVTNNLQIGIKELSEFAGYSKFHFIRKFTEHFGFSPHEFILRERVEKIKSLLINTSEPVGKIALDCGFFDASHMTNCFKKREGMTPVYFRSMWKENIKLGVMEM